MNYAELLRKSNWDKMDFIGELDSILEDITSAEEAFILSGDFKINTLAINFLVKYSNISSKSFHLPKRFQLVSLNLHQRVWIISFIKTIVIQQLNSRKKKQNIYQYPINNADPIISPASYSTSFSPYTSFLQTEKNA